MNKHIVFDLDGTLADTQKIHQQIESDFLKNFGVNIDPESIGKTYAGRSPQEWIPELLNQKGINFTQSDIDSFVESKDEKVIGLLNKGVIELIEGTKELLENLLSNGFKIGISSGACREFIDGFIDHFDFNGIIDASTSANEVINKKPAPDVFQKSFDLLEEKHGKANKKYVVGDGWSDVEGGHKSGAETIWINPNEIESKNDIFLNYMVNNLKEIENILIR